MGGDGTVTPACSPYEEDDKEGVVVVGWAKIWPGKGEIKRGEKRDGPKGVPTC